jgi:hypothetical protein
MGRSLLREQVGGSMKIDARFGVLKLDIPRAGAVVARFCLEGAKIHVNVNPNKTVSVQGQVGFLSGTRDKDLLSLSLGLTRLLSFSFFSAQSHARRVYIQGDHLHSASARQEDGHLHLRSL